MHLLYNIVIRIYGFFILLASCFDAKAKKLIAGQRDALKVLEREVDANSEYIWFHAASLGEFEQGRPVIEHLKRLNSDCKILLTFFSPSGYEVRKNYPLADVVVYLPLDTHSAAFEFVNKVKISKAIFIKYEFWPNYLLALHEKQIPTFSISSIFRPNQLFFKWYGKWYLSLLKNFTHLFVQDEDSKLLLNTHGIHHVTVSGDTRFDRVYDLFQQAKDLPLIKEFCGTSRVIVAGSTWSQDEELLVKYLQSNSDVKLILVPHEIHASHIAKIESLLDCDYVKYSQAISGQIANARCMVVDVIGILSAIYRYGDVAYIGGGFGVGIHNILEAAVYGVPVVFGPNYMKFREARELIAQGGAFSVETYDSLVAVLESISGDLKPGSVAGEYVKGKIGATDLIISQLDLPVYAAGVC